MTKFGGDSEIRTRDLFNAIELLSQLSYIPIKQTTTPCSPSPSYVMQNGRSGWT